MFPTTTPSATLVTRRVGRVFWHPRWSRLTNAQAFVLSPGSVPRPGVGLYRAGASGAELIS